MTRQQTRRQRVILILASVLAVAGLTAGIWLYIAIYAPNVDLGEKEYTHLHIPTGSHYDDVKQTLQEQDIIQNLRSFDWLAGQKNYPELILPGRYRIRDGMSNNALINLLRSGEQDPVMLTFSSIRTKQELASVVGNQIEADSLSLISLLSDNETMQQAGMDTLTGKMLFLPNTYEVFWNTTATELLARMQREYGAFWNEKRLKRAEEIGLTPEESGILASIVQSETSKVSEMDRIAGVYMNRLERNMPLQADPTVIFAHRDFGIRRVLNRHLTIDSPFNTYKYRGLPPGPIRLPAPHVIDAVLHYEEHDYLYFSAKADFSGYHSFAESYTEHLRNAREFRRALDERDIFR